jgi:hypothetical protein
MIEGFVWHPECMPGKEIDRARASSALEVIRQHPLLVLFAVSPAIAVVGVIWWLAGAGWAIAMALVLLVVGGVLVVRKR